ncbi:MAG: IS1634 family transposase [Acidobacteriota bacterium]
MPEATVANLQVALKASREGQVVVMSRDASAAMFRRPPDANLEYLNLAVLLDLWRGFGCESLLAELLAGGDVTARAVDVVAALVLHRCCEPGSKLHAQRWYPQTALPELTGLSVKEVNNTRVHRVLDALHDATPALMRRLPELYGRGDGGAAMFMDVTRTHFEGRGCQGAEWISWKQEQGRKLSIGIVLLVDGRGYPHRWRVIPGGTSDTPAMQRMVQTVAGLEWLGDRPLVFDRAMGAPLTAARLLASGVRFVTAAPANSIERYTTELPFRITAGLKLGLTEASSEQDIRCAAQAAREAGLQEVADGHFLVDLGVVDVEDTLRQVVAAAADRAPALRHNKVRKGRRAGLVSQLELARRIRDGLSTGRFASQAVAARQMGLTRARVTQLMNMLRLADDLQARILESPAGIVLSERRLRGVLKELDPERQRVLFEQALADAGGAPADAEREQDHDELDEPEEQQPPLPAPGEERRRLRLVGWFIPRLLVDSRRHARERLQKLQRRVAAINEDLATAAHQRDREVVRRRAYGLLEHEGWVDAFKVLTEPLEVPGVGGPISSWRCTLEQRPDVWERHQRYNGFMLLVCHPDVGLSGADIIALYRQRDTVEKDFQTIKSEIQLRPIFHRTEAKVEAHVTLCMLALLLERLLEGKLRAVGQSLSAAACLEVLKTCRLNLYPGDARRRSSYDITKPTEEQHGLLRALGLQRLVDEKAVRRASAPRLVTT